MMHMHVKQVSILISVEEYELGTSRSESSQVHKNKNFEESYFLREYLRLAVFCKALAAFAAFLLRFIFSFRSRVLFFARYKQDCRKIDLQLTLRALTTFV